MRMIIVSESYQNYQDGAASIQLTDAVREEGKCVGGDSESVDL